MEIRTFRENDRAEVIDLWEQCGLLAPQNDPQEDIDKKMVSGADLFLVGVDREGLAATVMGGYDGHRGWAYYLAVRQNARRLGRGREIMAELENRLRSLGCQKINLQIRTNNKKVLAFYFSLGFLEDDVLSLGKRLS
jgi:ribosomal protein S18 acetylase RimI-like enzyme